MSYLWRDRSYLISPGSWWWTGRTGMLRFIGSQRVGHDWVTDLIWSDTPIQNEKFKVTKKKNPGVSCHFLFQRIFPTQRLNPHLLLSLNWQAGSSSLVPMLFEAEYNSTEFPSLSVSFSHSPSPSLILSFSPLPSPLSFSFLLTNTDTPVPTNLFKENRAIP